MDSQLAMPFDPPVSDMPSTPVQGTTGEMEFSSPYTYKLTLTVDADVIEEAVCDTLEEASLYYAIFQRYCRMRRAGQVRIGTMMGADESTYIED